METTHRILALFITPTNTLLFQREIGLIKKFAVFEIVKKDVYNRFCHSCLAILGNRSYILQMFCKSFIEKSLDLLEKTDLDHTDFYFEFKCERAVYNWCTYNNFNYKYKKYEFLIDEKCYILKLLRTALHKNCAMWLVNLWNLSESNDWSMLDELYIDY